MARRLFLDLVSEVRSDVRRTRKGRGDGLDLCRLWEIDVPAVPGRAIDAWRRALANRSDRCDDRCRITIEICDHQQSVFVIPSESR